MKRTFILLVPLLFALTGFTQVDTSTNIPETTKKNIDTSKTRVDTLLVGNFIIIKKTRDSRTSRSKIEETPYKPGKLKTNWFIVDLGFANIDDKTNYSSEEARAFLRTIRPEDKPIIKDDLKLRTSKSSNVNIWVITQRLNLANGYFNLKYGLGLEMFNFRYENNISYSKNPVFIYRDTIDFSKNKLYTAYASVPFMLNVNTNPGGKGLTFSGGVSAGYLIGSHNKQVSALRGKVKTKGDLGLKKFRFAYVGELSIGPIHLYGTYSINPLHDTGLAQHPYSIGIRLTSF